MKIEKIFEKDINRNLNGVVKAEQLDEESVFVELDEYIVTKELQAHFEKFFETYVESVNDSDSDLSGRIGVWISGFFGSGKSHFLKILSYLLENKIVEKDGEGRRAYDFIKDKIKDNLLVANMKIAVEKNTDVILFNIDSRANADYKDDAILKVFLKVFNERVGYCADFPFVAHIERDLDKRNLYQNFKEKFKEITGTEWEKERDAFNFLRKEFIESLAHVTSQSVESATTHVEQMEKEFPLDVQNFCKWVKDYVENDDRNLLFLVDEVGQFIGRNSQMMLKLQTITEELGRICKGRAWVVVTSQADIDSAIGRLDKQGGQDFSKIQGRFSTRLQLSSSNTAEVIQKRLLLKTDEAKESLTEVYKQKRDIIRNQLILEASSHDMQEIFDDDKSFVINYPFVPYHFAIAQKIFESIRTKGAAGKHLAMGERSLLDAFQSAAKQMKDKDVNVLIPIYCFYDPIESFLEPAVKRTIEQANESEKLSEFDVKILKALFLIRYVDVVKSTIDNLVTLSIDRIDIDKIELGKKIKDSLDRLERFVLIARSGDEYNFLTNEEKEIENEIRETEVDSSTINKILSDIIFDDLLSGKKTYKYPENRQEYKISRYCNGHSRDGNRDEDIVIKVVTPLDLDYDSYSTEESRRLNSLKQKCILVVLADKQQVWNDLNTYAKTKRFLNQVTGNRQEQEYLLNEKRNENNIRKKQLDAGIKSLIEDSEVYAIDKKLENKPSNISAIIEECCNNFVNIVYSKLDMLKLSNNVESELESLLLADDTTRNKLGLNLDNLNKEAIDEVKQYLDIKNERNEALYLRDVVDHFHKQPYGWPDYEILVLVARLGLADKLQLSFEGTELPLKKAKEYFISPPKRAKVRVKITQKHDESKVREASNLIRKLFPITITTFVEKELHDKAKSSLEKWLRDLESFQAKSQTGNFPSKEEIENGKLLINGILESNSSFEFLDRLLQDAEKFEEFALLYEDLNDFYNNKLKLWQTLASALNEKFKINRKELDRNEEAKTALEKLKSIYENPKPYSEIKDINQLIEQISKIDNELVESQRVIALKDIDKQLEFIKNELFDENVPTTVRDQAIQPIQSCKNRVENSNSISGIIAELAEIKEHVSNAIDLHNDYAQNDSKSSENHSAEQKEPKPDNSAIPPSSSNIKQIMVLNSGEILKNAVSGDYIKDHSDIDNCLKALRVALIKALEDGQKVRLE